MLYFRIIDSNTLAEGQFPSLIEEEKEKALFLMSHSGVWGVADSPTGLACLIVGNYYADVDDEVIAWKMRVSTMANITVWLAALGQKAIVVDSSYPQPIFDPSKGEWKDYTDAIKLVVDSDYTMIASLIQAGMIEVYEKEAVFSNPDNCPAMCKLCIYFNNESKKCTQFNLLVDEEQLGCFQGIKRNGIDFTRNADTNEYKKLENVEIPPDRIKYRQSVWFPATAAH